MIIRANNLWVIVNKNNWQRGLYTKYDLFIKECYTDIDEALADCDVNYQLCISFEQMMEKVINNVD
jgi:hypothetical protein